MSLGELFGVAELEAELASQLGLIGRPGEGVKLRLIAGSQMLFAGATGADGRRRDLTAITPRSSSARVRGRRLFPGSWRRAHRSAVSGDPSH